MALEKVCHSRFEGIRPRNEFFPAFKVFLNGFKIK